MPITIKTTKIDICCCVFLFSCFMWFCLPLTFPPIIISPRACSLLVVPMDELHEWINHHRSIINIRSYTGSNNSGYCHVGSVHCEKHHMGIANISIWLGIYFVWLNDSSAHFSVSAPGCQRYWGKTLYWASMVTHLFPSCLLKSIT